MNTLRNLFTALFMAFAATAALAAEPAHDHAHAAPAAVAVPNAASMPVGTSGTANVAQQDESAVMARMHARMGEIARETDRVRRMQLMELQMRDMDALVEGNPNGEACHLMPGGKPGMGGMPMSARPGMGPRGGKPCNHCPDHRAAAGDACPMHQSGASCTKCDAMQKRMKAVEQRLDALERVAKSVTKPVAK